jgi:hypothetical protein
MRASQQFESDRQCACVEPNRKGGRRQSRGTGDEAGDIGGFVAARAAAAVDGIQQRIEAQPIHLGDNHALIAGDATHRFLFLSRRGRPGRLALLGAPFRTNSSRRAHVLPVAPGGGKGRERGVDAAGEALEKFRA